MLPLPQRKPWSLTAEALGARHGDLGSTDSCVESDRMVESTDSGQVEQAQWDMA